MGQTEQSIQIEGEILNLKRELKYATESLARVKADTQDVIATKERVTREISERNEDLTRILNEISDQKLKWALERQGQLDEIALKNSEAQNVLNRKAELNQQEEKIRQIESNEIKARNEARQLEFKNEQTKVDFENREKQIKVLQGIVDEDRKKLEKDKEEFKQRVLKVIKTVENL